MSSERHMCGCLRKASPASSSDLDLLPSSHTSFFAFVESTASFCELHRSDVTASCVSLCTASRAEAASAAAHEDCSMCCPHAAFHCTTRTCSMQLPVKPRSIIKCSNMLLLHTLQVRLGQSYSCDNVSSTFQRSGHCWQCPLRPAQQWRSSAQFKQPNAKVYSLSARLSIVTEQL